MDFAAAWALVENLLLAATAEGLGSVVHFPVKKEPEQIKELFNVPDGYMLPALVVLGYAKDDKFPLLLKTKSNGTNGENQRYRC